MGPVATGVGAWQKLLTPTRSAPTAALSIGRGCRGSAPTTAAWHAQRRPMATRRCTRDRNGAASPAARPRSCPQPRSVPLRSTHRRRVVWRGLCARFRRPLAQLSVERCASGRPHEPAPTISEDRVDVRCGGVSLRAARWHDCPNSAFCGPSARAPHRPVGRVAPPAQRAKARPFCACITASLSRLDQRATAARLRPTPHRSAAAGGAWSE